VGRRGGSIDIGGFLCFGWFVSSFIVRGGYFHGMSVDTSMRFVTPDTQSNLCSDEVRNDETHKGRRTCMRREWQSFSTRSTVSLN
jgi:hypothetical protein